MVLVQRLAKGQDAENCKITLVTDQVSNKTSKHYYKTISQEMFKKVPQSTIKTIILDGGIFKLDTIDCRKNITETSIFEINSENLIIDDLTPLLLNHSLAKVANWLVSNFKKVLIRASTDLISENDLKNLLNLSNLTINVIEKFSGKVWKNVNKKIEICSKASLIVRVRLCTGQGRVVSQVLCTEIQSGFLENGTQMGLKWTKMVK